MLKIDTTKLSNKGDFMVLVAILLIVILLSFAIFIASVDTFSAGFLSATITWKWKVWIYNPIDNLLERYWPFKDAQ